MLQAPHEPHAAISPTLPTKSKARLGGGTGLSSHDANSLCDLPELLQSWTKVMVLLGQQHVMHLKIKQVQYLKLEPNKFSVRQAIASLSEMLFTYLYNFSRKKGIRSKKQKAKKY